MSDQYEANPDTAAGRPGDPKTSILPDSPSLPDSPDLKADPQNDHSFARPPLSPAQENAWQALTARRPDGAATLDAARNLAVRNLWAGSGEKLSELAGLAAGTPSPENLFAFRKILAVHRAVQNEALAAPAALTGRAGNADALTSNADALADNAVNADALAAWRLPVGAPEVQRPQMADRLHRAGGLQATLDLAHRVARLAHSGLLQELDAFVAKTPHALTRESLETAWTQALLSGPESGRAEMVSNTPIALGQVFTRAGGGSPGNGRNSAAPDGGHTDAMLGESLANLSGFIGAVKDGLRLAAKSLRFAESSGSGHGGTAGTFAYPASPAAPSASSANSENWRLHLSKDGPFSNFVDVLGQLARASGRSLLSEDEFFKAVGYRAKLNAQAYRQATREAAAGKISPDQAAVRMAELTANPPDNIRPGDIDPAAYAAFDQTPGEFAKRWTAAAKACPELRFITPFVKMPADILNHIPSQGSPLAPLFRAFREDLAAGGARGQLALAKAATGTTLLLALGDLALNGQITGGGPADPAAKQALAQTGRQPYSLKIGATYIPYNRAEPLGATLGLAADLADICTHTDHADRETDPSEAANALAALMADKAMSRSYLQGLAELMDALADPQDARKVEACRKRLAASAGSSPGSSAASSAGSPAPGSSAGSPAPTGLADEAPRRADPYQQEVGKLIEAMRARIPGLTADLPARRDLWGRPVSYQGGPGAVKALTSPLASREGRPEPIDREMLKQGVQAPAPRRRVLFNGVPVDLGRPEFAGAQARYAELAGNGLKHPAHGQGCLDYLNAVVSGQNPKSAAYAARPDGPGGKAQFIRAAIAEYRELAKQQLLAEYPALRASLGA